MFQDSPDNEREDSFLNEFRQKLANQTTSSIDEKQKDMQRSKGVFLGTIAGISLACVVGWFILAPKNPANNIEIPVVKRPTTSVKTKPIEPGGMDIPNQDKSVYDIIDNSKDNKPSIENLLPPPEEPSIVDNGDDSGVESISDIINNLDIKPVVIVEQAKEPKAVKEEPKENKTISMAEAVKKIEESKTIDKPKEEAKKEEKKIEEKKPLVKAEPKIEEKKTVEVKATTPSKGVWQVQLISSKNKEASEKSWAGLVKKHSDLAKYSYEIEEAKIADNSIFYRLKAGSFKEKSDADSLCNKIKSQKGSCLVTQKQ